MKKKKRRYRYIAPSHKYERKGIYSIEEVLEKAVDPMKSLKGIQTRLIEKEFDGDMIYMDSQNYELFKKKGVKCVCCGIEGRFFAKEKNKGAKRYHFNLYAIDKKGREVLMTKDHITPKALGGLDILENYQTMCKICNEQKGSKFTKIV